MDFRKGKREKPGQSEEAEKHEPVPVPLNLKKDDLVSRLHDKGFSHYTMASIARPTTNNSHGKPLVSNLYSLRNNLTKPKKQKQQSILFNVPEQSYLNQQEEFIIKSKHSAFIHTTSAFFKNQSRLGEHSQVGELEDAERREMSQPFADAHPMPISVIGYQTTTSKFSGFPKPPGAQPRPPRQLTPITNGPFSNLPPTSFLRNPEATATNFNATGLNFGATGQLPPLPAQQFSATVQSFYKTNRTNTINPEQGREMKNSRLVVDKLRGKVDQDKDRETRGLSPLDEVYKQAQIEKEQELIKLEAAEDGKEPVKEARETTTLDIYLKLVLKNNSNIDEFMYVVPDPKSENPYKLEFTEYKKDQVEEYYTVSGKGFCHYKNNQPVEFIPLKDWLDERETFNKIQSLQFFQKFRKWKTLKKWKNTCQKYKRTQYKNSLKQNLFISDEYLRTALLKHREVCFLMSNLKFINLNSQAEQNEAISLQAFIEAQHRIRIDVKNNIELYSKTSRKIIEEGFDNCFKKLREASKNEANKGPGAGGRTNAKGLHRITETAYDALGFNKEMNYGQRREVRTVSMKILRFAFLADFIALDALTKIYLNSVADLKDRLSTLSKLDGERILTDVEKRVNFGGKAPMFEVEVIFRQNPPNEREVVTRNPLKYFNYNEGNDQAPEDFKEFNLIAHPFVIDFTNQSDRLNWRSQEEYNDGREFIQLRVENIDKMWLTISPNIKQFTTEISNILNEGLNNLHSFERWSKHRDIMKYAAILEDWDEQFGKDVDGTISDHLNPEDWLSNEQRPTGQQESILESVEIAFKRANEYLARFKEYLQVFWEYSAMDYDMLMNEDLAKPRVTFKCIFMLIEYHTRYFELNVPFQADIGLFRIKSLELKGIFKPKLEFVKGELERILPLELRNRSDKLLSWLKECEEKMKTESSNENIQKFITQKKFLEATEASLPLYKKSISIVDELYKLLMGFHVALPKEDTQLFFNDIKAKETNIGSDIMAKNDAMNKQQEVLSKHLKSELIPTLMEEAKVLNEKVILPKYLDENSPRDEMIEELTEIHTQLETLKEKVKSFTYFEEEFKLEPTEFDNVKSLEQDIKARKVLWQSLKDWDKIMLDSENSMLSKINYKEIDKLAEKYYAEVKMCKKTIPPDNLLIKKLESNIKMLSNTMPIVFWLNNKHLGPDDFAKIRAIIKVDSKFDFTEVTLKELLDIQVFNYQNEIVKLSRQVEEEAKLKDLFQEAEEEYNKIELSLVPLRDDQKEPAQILANIDETLAKIEKVWGKINLIYSSRYLEKIKDQVHKKRNEVYDVTRMLDEWIKFQGQYIYLETIFSNVEFKKELKESTTFDYANTKYKKMAKEAYSNWKKNKTVKANIVIFKEINEKMAQLNKNVNDFLDTKRVAINRLHFLSNDEMIILLAKSDKPQVVQQYIGKIYENVKGLHFLEKEKEATFDGLVSREGEQFIFNIYYSLKNENPYAYSGVPYNIEINTKEMSVWMEEAETKIRETLISQFRRAVEDIIEPERREEFYRVHPAQPISVINQFYWTYNTSQNIKDSTENSEALWNWYKEIVTNIELLTNIVRSGVKGYRHNIICSVVTAEVHNRDIVYDLMEKGVTSVEDFAWEQQLRFEVSEDNAKTGIITIRQINAVFKYGYEYIGPTSRIVITPLTDKCWITITSALNLGLGAAPAGPAGTGKTESTKDLAKALGRLCIVFNCSEQIEIGVIERLFRGICFKGAWTCLDEFNRINIEVLSVIAQQLLEVKTVMVELAVNNRKAASGNREGGKSDNVSWVTEQAFKFVGKDCKLSMNSGFFITMNPGYAGRTELPDNLKVLFRPVSMMIPDYGLIAEILLLSEGFSDSKKLASKMKNLYKLASEQLSQQKHYDFGMRAVKSVLEMAGRLKRENPQMKEELLLIKAMRDSNIPKFLEEDLKLFNALVTDLFPEAEVREISDLDLDKSISSALKDRSLQSEKVEQFKLKIRQIFDTINVRFGSMVVGDAMVGKSTAIQTLAKALTRLRLDHHPNERFKNVELVVINPKSITMGELYGQEIVTTKDWVDGLASFHIRRYTNRTDPELQSWVVFDGPVDAHWIENLNSVLDDSRLLCLANGQRIRLGDNIRLLFEVGDLKAASLATVSRCGMVYMDPKDLGWRPYVQSWLDRFMRSETNYDQDLGAEKFTPEIIKNLQDYMEDTIPEFLARPRVAADEPIEIIPLQKIKTLCDYMEVYLSKENGYRADDNPEKKERCVRLAFILALAWAFGGALLDNGRDRMSAIIKNKFLLHGIEESIFNLDLNFEEQSLRLWKDRVSQHVIEDGSKYHDILIPTVDTVKISYLIEKLFDLDKNVLLTGGSGVGKSVLALNIFKDKECASKFLPLVMIFSAKTTSNETQETILNSLHVESKHKRSSKPGMKNVVMIDDINMPEVEEYGAQPPIELLRQLTDLKVFYEKREMTMIEIDKTCLFAVAAPPTGGRNQMTTRFTRHFSMICMPEPDQKNLYMIFSSILRFFLKSYSRPVVQAIDSIVNCTVSIYHKIVKEKLPIPSKFHYTYNLRDVSRIFQGLTSSSPDLIKTTEMFAKLWFHEASRVLHDRLIDDGDRKWFTDSALKILTEKMQITFETAITTGKAKIRFSGLRSPDDVSFYEYSDSSEQIKIRLEHYLKDYNEDDRNPSKLKLVFFEEALDHFLRLFRILRYPRGNAMLVGIEGLGKQSLTRLASHILGYMFMELQSRAEADVEGFKQYLRENVLNPCAGPAAEKAGKKGTFLIVDNQITHDFILEMINNLLNSGEIPNLFPAEEKDKFVNDLTPVVSSASESVDPAGVYKKYIERIKNNLHIIMSMSPIGDSLRVRCRQFPALIDCCTIDWYNSWPEEALFEVAISLVKDIQEIDESETTPICKLFQNFHLDALEAGVEYFKMTGKKIYITPKTMLDLVNIFGSLISIKKSEFADSIGTLKRGSQRLAEVKEMIAQLEEDIIKMTPILEEKSKDTAARSVEMDELSKISQVQEEKSQIEAEAVAKTSAEIQTSTAKVNEVIEGFKKEIDNIKVEIEKLETSDIAQLKSKTMLPDIMTDIIKCLRLFLRKKVEKFDDMPPLPVILRELIITPKKFKDDLIDMLNKLIAPKGVNHFEEENIKQIQKVLDTKLAGKETKAGATGSDMMNYIKTMLKLYGVKKYLLPHEDRKEKLEAEYAIAKKKLDEANAILEKTRKETESYINEFQKLNSEKIDLETKLAKNKLKLENASQLGVLLKDEEIRWKNSVRELQIEAKSIVGNVVVSAGFMTYLGPLSEFYRKGLVQKWTELVKLNKLSISPTFSFIEVIGDRLLLREWYNKGLPADETSSENAIMIYRGLNWPLLIDPQMQANNWLKKTFAAKDSGQAAKPKEKYNRDEDMDDDDFEEEEQRKLNQEGLKMIKFDTSPVDKVKIIKAALINGFPLLVEDVGETLDPILEPLLSRRTLQLETMVRQRVKVGNDESEVNPSFRLYLTTKLANPHYLPNIFIKTNIINFTVTPKGLEEQMLCDVVMIENPKLEIDKNANLENMSRFKRILMQKEKEILESLNNSIASLVETSDLINQLKESKATAENIQKQASESEQSSLTINRTRDKYRGVAVRGSILYFVIDEVSRVDPMYQYSLSYINKLFCNSIADSPKEESEQEEDRNKRLLEVVTKAIYTNVSRGLFEQHKFIFSLLICVRIMIRANLLDPRLWDLFLRGPPPYDNQAKPPLPAIKSVSDFSWDNAFYLDIHFAQFQGLCSDITVNHTLYEHYSNLNSPVEADLPEKCRLAKNSLSDFDRVLVIKVIRQEKVLYSLMSFVKKAMGEYFVGSVSVQMDRIFAESDCRTPIIFVLSQGADPRSAIEKLAVEQEKRIGHELFPISLGQGQGENAQRIIDECSKNGHWALLENCHLAQSYMPLLEKTVERLQRSDKVHPDFRLFLTSMPAKYFPVLILQNGIKLTTEPPRGLRANMLRSLNNLQPFTEGAAAEISHPRLKEALMRMTMGLCFFHAIVQERRKFGPLGWNKRYEFNDSDFETSKNVLESMLLNLPDEKLIPWDTLIFLTGTINYGGRVTDEHDARLMMTIIQQFYNPEILNPRFA